MKIFLQNLVLEIATYEISDDLVEQIESYVCSLYGKWKHGKVNEAKDILSYGINIKNKWK